jgi:APA family basic amino acid/polyamine antiporter
LFCYGKDGLFFKQATELNKNQVPAKALWVQCIWACVYLKFVRNFCIVVVLYPNYLGVFILRKKEPNADRPYKAFGYPFVPALVVTVAICLTLLIYDTFNTD